MSIRNCLIKLHERHLSRQKGEGSINCEALHCQRVLDEFFEWRVQFRLVLYSGLSYERVESWTVINKTYIHKYMYVKCLIQKKPVKLQLFPLLLTIFCLSVWSYWLKYSLIAPFNTWIYILWYLNYYITIPSIFFNKKIDLLLLIKIIYSFLRKY